MHIHILTVSCEYSGLTNLVTEPAHTTPNPPTGGRVTSLAKLLK